MRLQAKQAERSGPEADQRPPRVSRLPRRIAQHPSVAELVARYQDFIPANGVEELARTALAPPPVSESEQEDLTTTLPNVNTSRPALPRSTLRGRHRQLAKKPSTSDFESGYAVNAAPRLRRSLGGQGQGQYTTRIPGGSSFDSLAPSRRASPDKRESRIAGEPPSPPYGGKLLPPPPGRTVRGKSSSRGLGRDVSQQRTTSSGASKPTFRRPPQGAGTKVSNIARHFERINRENEKANRRYAVIRGRKVRPVASSRATVEVLESIKDAIKDESDISDSSSEADDEGGDEDEGRKSTDKATESSPDQSTTLPAATVQKDLVKSAEQPPVQETGAPVPTSTPPLSPPAAERSFPPSPFLSSSTPETNPPRTPPTLSPEELPGRNSIFRQAFSGLWPPQLPLKRAELDDEDPLNDPEHIFRDSSMVVRTDEPTSIIALALK
jgi:1-phosphatidylinositol-3-phosphate 5-kinase